MPCPGLNDSTRTPVPTETPGVKASDAVPTRKDTDGSPLSGMKPAGKWVEDSNTSSFVQSVSGGPAESGNEAKPVGGLQTKAVEDQKSEKREPLSDEVRTLESRLFDVKQLSAIIDEFAGCKDDVEAFSLSNKGWLQVEKLATDITLPKDPVMTSDDAHKRIDEALAILKEVDMHLPGARPKRICTQANQSPALPNVRRPIECHEPGSLLYTRLSRAS